MKRIFSILLSIVFFSTVHAQELTVAERNAAQGFNDTIDRLAPDFVTVSLVVCDPDEVLYSTLGHAALHLQCPVVWQKKLHNFGSDHHSRFCNDLFGSIIRFALYRLELAHYPVQYLACYWMVLAEILGSSVCGNHPYMVSRNDW